MSRIRTCNLSPSRQSRCGCRADGLQSGCDNFDPTDIARISLDTKKKLPGERKPVFPEGVPGVQQGVPPELIKGNQRGRRAGSRPAPVAGADGSRGRGQAEAASRKPKVGREAAAEARRPADRR